MSSLVASRSHPEHIINAIENNIIDAFNESLDEEYPGNHTEYEICQSSMCGLTQIIKDDISYNMQGIVNKALKCDITGKKLVDEITDEVAGELSEKISDGIISGLDASLKSLMNLDIIIPKYNLNSYIKNFFEEYIGNITLVPYSECITD